LGSKNKLKRFNQNLTFPNVIQPSREELIENKYPLKGNWRKDFFKNENSIVLELGCGKGEYSVYLAKENLHKNFIGIDLKGARLWAGAKESLILELKNVAFIRAQIELVSDLFSENEIDEIWITFPDPQIKYKRTKHRLTNPQFLAKYKNILKPEGFIHLKTDSEHMHGYTLGLLEGMGIEVEYAHHDLYTNPYAPKEASAVQTYYEKIYLEENKPITYLKFKFP
tara:strand:- start:2981 stop:3655 length:675 start_codon:yes stop_codon:yes gene_type:complete